MSSVINSFPGYEFIKFGEDGKPHNIYHGEDVGFGGYVYSKPGMYGRTVCFDVSGMHPASIRALNCFGEYTKNFGDLVDARLAIKHKDFESARKMLGGKLAPYLNDESQAKELTKALKIAVNSVYGLTSANFDNPFRDPRNVNNIVALRGALFMVDLKHEVQSRGFTVIHCKTDSIKVVEPDEEITKFIMEYGIKYGYQFEIEHVFEKICLVNDAVYIAKLTEDDPDSPGEWTATGAQFAVPYVFKKLFSKEDIIFEDLCETKEVKQGSIYIDMNEETENIKAEAELEKLDALLSNYEKQAEKEKDIPRENRKMYKLWDRYVESGGPERHEELKKLARDSHNYIFVGKVGRFCPIKPGCGGGVLYREKDGKYYAVTGTKGYRWLESEMVKQLGKEDDIDKSYYNKLVNDAADNISKYGDLEWFISDDPYIPPPKTDDLPWVAECGRETCLDCPNLTSEDGNLKCKLGHDVSDLDANLMDSVNTSFDVR